MGEASDGVRADRRRISLNHGYSGRAGSLQSSEKTGNTRNESKSVQPADKLSTRPKRMVKAIAVMVSVLIVGMSGYAFLPSQDSEVIQPARTNALLDLAWTAEGDQVKALFGYSVSSAGDVNNDGYADVIIGARDYDAGQTDEGMAFVFHGSASGLSASPSWIAESDQAYARLGNSVSSAGDVNNDGYDDVVVGAHVYDGGESDEGRAYLYLGSSSGLSGTPAWTAEGNQANCYFGSSVASAGDVNNDGYDDVLVAALSYSNGNKSEGRVSLYMGSPTGLPSTPSWFTEGDQDFAYYGRSVASAGDVNNDGYDDVIIGAYYYDKGERDEGCAFLYLGSSSGLAASPSWIGEINQVSAWFGYSVSSAGDVNNDGYDDVLVGAVGYDNPDAYEGSAYLYLGSASGLSSTPAWTGEGNQANAYYGVVSSAGDVNSDGYSDVVVGAYLHQNGTEREGKVYVYLGSASGLSTTPSWTNESNQYDSMFGSSLSSAGDVNGDGADEIIIGAYQFDNGQTYEGWAFVYRCLDLPPPQTRFDLTLVVGWNLVTVPLVGHSYRSSTLGLQFGDVVAGWNSTTQIYDRNYIVGISPPTFDFPINPSEGYWIYVSGPRTLALFGDKPVASQTRNIVVPEGGGFAIIGLASLDTDVMASHIPPMYSGGSISVVESWNATAKKWWAYYPGLPFTDYAMPPGLAAFVWCTASGTLSYTP